MHTLATAIEGQVQPLAIYVTPVSHAHDGHNNSLTVNPIDNPIVANPNTPVISCTLEFLDA